MTRTDHTDAINAVFTRWGNALTRGTIRSMVAVELNVSERSVNKYDIGDALRAMKAAGRIETRRGGRRWYRTGA